MIHQRMGRITGHLGSLALALLFLIACRTEKAAPNILAKVDDHLITTNDYRRKVQEFSGKSGQQPLDESVRHKALNDLIERELLFLEAEKRNIMVSPAELETEMRKIGENYPGKEFEKMLASRRISPGEWRDELNKTLLLKKVYLRLTDAPVTITDEAIAQHFEQNQASFDLPERVKALHIHVDSEPAAFDILAQLRKGTPFETLAREYSLGPEAQSGGDLGTVARGNMPEIFDEILFSLEIGKISRVVASEYGYHIFKIIDRLAAQKRSLEEVREPIRAALLDIEKQKQYGTWLEARLKKARIMKNTELLAKLNF